MTAIAPAAGPSPRRPASSSQRGLGLEQPLKVGAVEEVPLRRPGPRHRLGVGALEGLPVAGLGAAPGLGGDRPAASFVAADLLAQPLAHAALGAGVGDVDLSAHGAPGERASPDPVADEEADQPRLRPVDGAGVRRLGRVEVRPGIAVGRARVAIVAARDRPLDHRQQQRLRAALDRQRMGDPLGGEELRGAKEVARVGGGGPSVVDQPGAQLTHPEGRAGPRGTRPRARRRSAPRRGGRGCAARPPASSRCRSRPSSRPR